MEGDDNLADKGKICAIPAANGEVVVTALRRLAYLEDNPIRSIENLQEWRFLRKWVLDNDLIKDYQNQEYFRKSREVTKKQYRPKNPNSVLKRIWNYISGLT